MSDTVKSVFGILIKIPIMVFIVYLIFNCFVFILCYFKLLGVSYIAMQTALENNCIPQNERAILEKYMKENIETPLLRDVKFTDDTQFERVQYGQLINVGIEGRYVFLWPLVPAEQVEGTFLGEQGFSGRYKSDAELENLRKKKEENEKSNIIIKYQVPGLRYYPDLQ